MIFFTLGTERHPFERMVCAAEGLAVELPEEEIFVQIGNHPREPEGCRFERWMPFEALSRHIAEARLVVSHAGAGTILTCHQFGRKPIVLAREAARGEHQDDHQRQLVRRMVERRGIFLAKDETELRERILATPEEATRLAARDDRPPALALELAAFLDGLDGGTPRSHANPSARANSAAERS